MDRVVETIFMVYFLYTLTLFGSNLDAQLVVNVKNKGGDMLRESIEANTTQDTVTLEFQESDGTLVTQFIDFKNEIQVFRVLVLGEEERGVSQFQVMCFITRFIKNEFISSDAMSKLRQKNPGAIRHPEDDKGTETHVQHMSLDLERAHVLSPYITSLCHDARDMTYLKDADLRVLSRTLGKDYNILQQAVHNTNLSKIPLCRTLRELSHACTCRYHICIGWYPCGLKYCRGKDSTGKVVSYRCGIKTCRKCRNFDFYVRMKSQCLWDEELEELSPSEATSSNKL